MMVIMLLLLPPPPLLRLLSLLLLSSSSLLSHLRAHLSERLVVQRRQQNAHVVCEEANLPRGRAGSARSDPRDHNLLGTSYLVLLHRRVHLSRLHQPDRHVQACRHLPLLVQAARERWYGKDTALAVLMAAIEVTWALRAARCARLPHNEHHRSASASYRRHHHHCRRHLRAGLAFRAMLLRSAR